MSAEGKLDPPEQWPPGYKQYSIAAGVKDSYISIQMDVHAASEEDAKTMVREFMTFTHEWAGGAFIPEVEVVGVRDA